MNHILHNPAFNALSTGDAHYNLGTDTAKFFPEQVSPFVGLPNDSEAGFIELHQLLPEGRVIVHGTTNKLNGDPRGWETFIYADGLQFVFNGDKIESKKPFISLPLNESHIDEMIALAKRTRPGPFDKRTIEFGNYHGVFDNDKLVAMAGQRMHVGDYTEISAVCTHPDHTGRGYAASLITEQMQIILAQGRRPFLHSRADNDRAIEVYKRLGFEITRPMNFYFMKRKYSL